jgi:small-conductance mechanosensitive channel
MKFIYTLLLISFALTSCLRAQYDHVGNNLESKTEAIKEPTKAALQFEPIDKVTDMSLSESAMTVVETNTTNNTKTITSKSLSAKSTLKAKLIVKYVKRKIAKAKKSDDDYEYEDRGFSLLSLLSFFAGIGAVLAVLLAISTLGLVELLVGAGLTLLALIFGFAGVSSGKSGKGFGIIGIILGFIMLTVFLIAAIFLGLLASLA